MESFLAADISEYLGVNERAGSRSKGNTLDWGRDFSPARENVALRRTLNEGRGRNSCICCNMFVSIKFSLSIISGKIK